MKTLSVAPSRYGPSMGVINVLLAVGLTVLSFRYIQPKDCYQLCGGSEDHPCPAGTCGIGEQKAGWPFPAFIDAPGGGSPTSGWGLVGPEDPALFVPLVLDIGFYSLMGWLVMWFIQLIPRKVLLVKGLRTSLLLNVLFAMSLWIFSWIFGVPIGRGHNEQVYVDTPTDRYAVSGFFPIVSIAVDEMIQTYGNPDEVWITSEGSMDTSSTRLVLHWSSIGIFVQLPEIADHIYFVKKTAKVKMIIFTYEEPIIAFDGKPIGEKKIP